jgi:hypothetical protein
MGADNHAEWRAAMRDPQVVRGMLEDYRAGLTVDYADEVADRATGHRVRQPLLVLWSSLDDLAELYGDPLAIWENWADDVTGRGIRSPITSPNTLPRCSRRRSAGSCEERTLGAEAGCGAEHLNRSSSRLAKRGRWVDACFVQLDVDHKHAVLRKVTSHSPESCYP